MKENIKPWIVISILTASAVFWRLINWHYMIAPNLEIVTASTLIGATFLPRRFFLVIPLFTMIISDIIIGNSLIFLFTWSAFALIGLGGLYLRRFSTSRPFKLIGWATFSGLTASLFFFLYTNFGVWLIGHGTFYPRTLAGLWECYVMGIPFYRTMFIGNAILVPTYFTAALYAKPALSYLLTVAKNQKLSQI